MSNFVSSSFYSSFRKDCIKRNLFGFEKLDFEDIISWNMINLDILERLYKSGYDCIISEKNPTFNCMLIYDKDGNFVNILAPEDGEGESDEERYRRFDRIIDSFLNGNYTNVAIIINTITANNKKINELKNQIYRLQEENKYLENLCFDFLKGKDKNF